MAINVQIILAEDLETNSVGQGQVNKLVNPVLKMRVPFIPGGLTFTISIITTGMNNTKSHEFSVKMIDPSKEDTDSTKIMYNTGTQTLNANMVMTDNFNINIDMKNHPFYKEGTYKVIFEVDGQPFEQSFDVVANQVFDIPESQN